MKQDEFNAKVVEALEQIVKEVRRSTKSHDWDDMPGLQDKIENLKRNLPTE